MFGHLGIVLLVAIATTAAYPQVPKGCVCPFNYAPVCGTDGETYGNQCELSCAQQSKPNLAFKNQGPCLKDCICPMNYKPICGTDGKTYSNNCQLRCASATKKSDGPCETVNVVPLPIAVQPPCICPMEFKPVCGSDGLTYSNDCTLNCATAMNPSLGISHSGECVKVNVVDNSNTCACVRNYKPVCGTDGKTYENPCLLNCAQVNNPDIHVRRPGKC